MHGAVNTDKVSKVEVDAVGVREMQIGILNARTITGGVGPAIALSVADRVPWQCQGVLRKLKALIKSQASNRILRDLRALKEATIFNSI